MSPTPCWISAVNQLQSSWCFLEQHWSQQTWFSIFHCPLHSSTTVASKIVVPTRQMLSENKPRADVLVWTLSANVALAEKLHHLSSWQILFYKSLFYFKLKNNYMRVNNRHDLTWTSLFYCSVWTTLDRKRVFIKMIRDYYYHYYYYDYFNLTKNSLIVIQIQYNNVCITKIN